MGLKETILFWHACVLGVGKKGGVRTLPEVFVLSYRGGFALPNPHRPIYIQKLRLDGDSLMPAKEANIKAVFFCSSGIYMLSLTLL